MTSLISSPLLNLRRVNIVPEKIQTHLTNGNSVQIKFSHSSKLESPFFASTAVRRYSGQTQTHAHRSPIRSVKLSSDMATNEDRIAKISSTIRVIPDFPKPGLRRAEQSSRQNNNTSESSHRSGDNKRGGNQQARNGNHFDGNQGQNNKNGHFKKRRFNNDGKTSAPAPVVKEGERPPIICFKCGGEGHISPNCAMPFKACYNCGREGHLARFCRSPKTSSARMEAPKDVPGKPKPVV